MHKCSICTKVYDKSRYSFCPYCSKELEKETNEKIFKYCPICKGIMFWDRYWLCSNCGKEVDTGIIDSDGIIIV